MPPVSRTIHTLSLAASLALTWWLLSGQPGALVLALGAASVLLVVWLSRRMQLLDQESHPVHLRLALLGFWGWLLLEMLKANLQVVRLVLSRRPALQPRVLRVPHTQATDLGRVILANSITLTPGTVTIDVDEDSVLVHALTPASAAAVAEGSMDRRVPRGMESAAGTAGAQR